MKGRNERVKPVDRCPPQVCRICGKHEDVLLSDLCQSCFTKKHPELDFANDEERSWAEVEPHLEEEQRDRPSIR